MEDQHLTEKISPVAGFANQIYPISKGLRDYIHQHSYCVNIQKNKFLVKSGEICKSLYLVEQGMLRGFIKEGHKEITTWVTAENEMVTSIHGLNMQQPAVENIQALENCRLWAVDFVHLQYAYDHFMEMNVVGRKLLEIYYRDAEERALIARLSKAESRYRYFMATKEALLNRIPVKYIASFLGVTTETLSRIRSKMKKK